MADSRKMSEFTPLGSFADDDYLTGLDNDQVDESLQNVKVRVQDALAGLATDQDLTDHASDATLHLTASQNDAIDAAQNPSGANPLLTTSAGDAAYKGIGDPPALHAASHAAGQADAVTPAAIGAATTAQGAKADTALQPGDEVTELKATGATNGHVVTSDGADGLVLSPQAGAPTDLAAVPDLTTVDITSSTGDDATIPAAVSGGNAGVMTGADKATLNTVDSQKHTHANKGALDKVSDTGAGDAWLANNGQYTVPAGGGQEALYVDGSNDMDAPVSFDAGSDLDQKRVVFYDPDWWIGLSNLGGRLDISIGDNPSNHLFRVMSQGTIQRFAVANNRIIANVPIEGVHPPTDSGHLATKQYVDDNAGGGGPTDIADLDDRANIANKIAVTDGLGGVTLEDKPTPGEAQTQDLGQGTHNTTTLQLTISDGGQPTTLPAATGTLAGLMTSAHQAKVESDDTPADPRTPTAHDSTHDAHNALLYANIAHESATNNPHSVLATQISDFDTEVANNTTVAAHTTKLAGIEDGATGDQTPAEIKTAYESNANTNEFSDLEKLKLSTVENGATIDQTPAEIKTAYESNADTNAFTDADQTKLGNALTSTGSIGSHTDVDLTGITTDQILKWDGNQFIAATDETAAGGVPSDAALNGYTELGTDLGAPAATVTIPVDGRLYEFNAALTVDLTITVGTTPTAPTCASSVIYVKPGGNTVTFSGVDYWAGGAMPALGTLMRYVISTTVTGDVLADGEAFEAP